MDVQIFKIFKLLVFKYSFTENSKLQYLCFYRITVMDFCKGIEITLPP
jgi:hypothetical protein